MTAHPLDPLTAAEIDLVRELLDLDEAWRYASIELVEPAKAELAAYADGAPAPSRRAEVVCFRRRDGATHRARVDLSAAAVESFEPVPGVQPNFTIDEWEECDAMLRRHPDVVAALAARGVTDLAAVFIDTWTYGAALVPDAYAGRRLGWSDVWVRRVAGGNPYAGPVNGLHFVVDVGAMELLEIEDTYAVPRPEIMGEYRPHLLPEALRGHRPERAPLEVTQPGGPGFTVDGHEVRWQNWRLRVGFNHREGLTLHQVGYTDAGRERSIAHKLSFAEMMVPYRDPGVDHYRRTAFDIGEWGLGFLTQSLTLGCDCLGEIRYLDAVMHDSAGRPYTIENAICLHEEDSAVGWKHVDHDGTAEVRRQRRFVVSFHVTVANYEYLTYWRFYEDGSIECEVRATGIMVVSHLPEGAAHPHGTLVDTRTYAPFHQHFVVARLDLDVDGTDNTVVRSETVTEPIGPANPYGLGVRQVKAPLVVEGPDDYAWETQRAWSVTNPDSLNAHGTPVAYKLVPGAAIPSFFDPASPVFQRAEVVGHTVWVTPHDPDQRWPAGEFVNQGGPGMGMPRWVAARRGTDRTDVVLWYVFGIHHVPRPEDWPVMPVDTISFWLKPSGFFDRNPALDVEPHPAPHCHAPVTPRPTST